MAIYKENRTAAQPLGKASSKNSGALKPKPSAAPKPFLIPETPLRLVDVASILGALGLVAVLLWLGAARSSTPQ